MNMGGHEYLTWKTRAPLPFLHVILFTAMNPPNLNPYHHPCASNSRHIHLALLAEATQGAHSSPDHSLLNARHNVFGIKQDGEELVNFIEASLRV